MTPTPTPLESLPDAPASLATLRYQLEARQKQGLLDLLLPARGRVLAGRFAVGYPFAAGGQALLFEGHDLQSGHDVLIKQPFFDYRRPIQHGRREAAALRETLRVEHQVLNDCETGHLPRALALLQAPAVVPAAGDFLVLREETFLVEERIRGITLEQSALTVWRNRPPAHQEAWARKVAREYLIFWESLRQKGHFYGDTSARNILFEEGTGRVRTVDAACVVPAAEAVYLREATPAFLTPGLYRAAQRGEPVPGDAASMLPVLARVLYFALTRREPLNGDLPDVDDGALTDFSEECRAALRTMLSVDHDHQRLSQALQVVRSWAP